MTLRTPFVSAAALLGLAAAAGPAFAASAFDPPISGPMEKCADCVMKMRPVVGLALQPGVHVEAPDGAPANDVRQISRAVLQRVEVEWRQMMQAAGATLRAEDVAVQPRAKGVAKAGAGAAPPTPPAAKTHLVTATFGPADRGGDIDVFAAAGLSATWSAKTVPGAPETFALREQAAAKRAEAAEVAKAVARYKSDEAIYVEARKETAQESFAKQCSFAPTSAAGQFIAPGGGQMVGSVRRVSHVGSGAGCIMPPPRKGTTEEERAANFAAKNQEEVDRIMAEAEALDAEAAKAAQSGQTRMHELVENATYYTGVEGKEKTATLVMSPVTHPEAVSGETPNFSEAIQAWAGGVAIDETKDEAKTIAQSLFKTAQDLRGKAKLVRRNGVAVLNVGGADGVCPGDTFKLSGMVQRSPSYRGPDKLMVYDWVRVDYLARVTETAAHSAKVEFLEKSATPLKRDEAALAERDHERWAERKAGDEVIATGEWAGVYGDKAAWTTCGQSA